MKLSRRCVIALCIGLAVLAPAPTLLAEGPVAVYAMVQKVVFEPGETAPTAIQVWGVFVWVDGGLKSPGPINVPQRGYMYFKLPPGSANAAAARKQWAEIRTTAGTDQVLAFGDWNYAGPFEDLHVSVPGGSEDVRVRRQNEMPAKAITYPLRTALFKVANDSAHESLRTLMKAFLQR